MKSLKHTISEFLKCNFAILMIVATTLPNLINNKAYVFAIILLDTGLLK